MPGNGSKVWGVSLRNQTKTITRQRQRGVGCCGAQGTAAKKAEQLRRMVGEYGQCGELAYLKCPLPLDPGVLLTGILSEECSVFKSALAPLRLTFRTAGTPLLVPLSK